MSLKVGIKKFGNCAVGGMTKEVKQMHSHDNFIPRKKSEITQKQWKSRCEAVNLIKEKKTGEIKGCCCADGYAQHKYITKEESASPTAATESVLLTGTVEAKEKRKVITLDVPNAFIQTRVDNPDERIILVLRGIAADILVGIAPEYYGDYVREERGKTQN